jgi:hypothetical protein
LVDGRRDHFVGWRMETRDMLGATAQARAMLLCWYRSERRKRFGGDNKAHEEIGHALRTMRSEGQPPWNRNNSHVMRSGGPSEDNAKSVPANHFTSWRLRPDLSGLHAYRG